MADPKMREAGGGLCKEIHKRVDEKLEKIEEYIDTNTQAVQKLTESQAKQDQILELLQKQQSQILAVLTERATKNSENAENAQEPKKKFYEYKWFTVVVVAGCILLLMTVGVAIGYNVLDKYANILRAVQP